MTVTNINGTSDDTCKCESWLAHWKHYSGQTPPTSCSETMCTRKPEVGAHVQTPGNNTWYIIPLCERHNAMQGKSIAVKDRVALASANVSQTCGKQ